MGGGCYWRRRFRYIENDFALMPIALTDQWAKKLGGITLKDIKLTTYQNGQKQEVYKGKLFFTHFGISGPTVLNMSKAVGELLQYGDVIIALDLFPKLDHKDKAVVFSGGVALKEVDFKTMQSRIVPNLYIVGDVLNIDRPSGGYLLQLCWTTGYVAGSNV